MLNTSADELYKFNMVASACDGLSKVTFQTAADPPHEIIERVIGANPPVLDQLHVAVANGDLPTTHYNYPLVCTSAQPPLPLAIYSDGLPHTLVDSVLGVWLINLVTGTRHIMAIKFGKKLTCSCGCKGWCSYYNMCLRFWIGR